MASRASIHDSGSEQGQPALSQLIGNDARMAALCKVFRQYPNGMHFEAFAETMARFFPQHFRTLTTPTSGSSHDESGDEEDGDDLGGGPRYVTGNLTKEQYATLNLRQRRALARMEVAGVVKTDLLRLLFDRMDIRNTFTVTWSDFLGYVVEEASSAGVFTQVKNEYRAYSHARTRHGEPLPEMSPAGDIRQVDGEGGVGGGAATPSPSLQYMDGCCDPAQGANGAVVKEELKRQKVLRHVWRGHLNKYGGKLVTREKEESERKQVPSRAQSTAMARTSLHGHAPKDLAQIEFIDGLPTNPVAFAVSCRYRPLSLYSKATFALLKCFCEEDLGGVKPSLVAYIASSDTLLVYSSADGVIRGFCGLFSTPHVTPTADFRVTAGLLRSWRQRPSAFPEMLFIAGSYGCIQQISVPHGRRDSDNVVGPREDPKDHDDPKNGKDTRKSSDGRELHTVRVFDNVHDRKCGGILDFVLSDTHLFSCGFDHRIISTNLSSGFRIVIGHPGEAIRSLGFNTTMHAIIAVTFSSDALYLWDAKAVTTVPGTRFSAGDFDASGKSNAADVCARIIGVECPEDMPHVITADDEGIVRVWDLRSRACVQQVRADGMRDEADEEDAEVVYGSKPKTNAADDDEVKFSRALKLKAEANRAKRLNNLVNAARTGFNLSTVCEERPSSATAASSASAAALARGVGAVASSMMLPGQGNGLLTATATASCSQAAGASSVLVSLAYFSATREIVTCTTDTIYTLQHNQREDPNLCDVDYVVNMFHAIREGGSHSSQASRGSFLLQGPSRLSLWDVEGGFRTRIVDRALNPIAPNTRKEIVALCLDDMGNRVFLSFPDGSLEVHDLRAVFDSSAGAAEFDEAQSAGPGELAALACGSTIIPGKKPLDSVLGESGSPTAMWPPEIVTELVYLSDQKLLCGATTKGRVLLRSEDESNSFFTFVCPATSDVPMSGLTVSGELGLFAVSCAAAPKNADNGSSSEKDSKPSPPVVTMESTADFRAFNSPATDDVNVICQVPEPAQESTIVNATPSQEYNLFLYDYRHAGVLFNPPTTIQIKRSLEEVLFLGDLPVFLTLHDSGDVVLWSCPPVHGGVFPLVGMNVFTSGQLVSPVPFNHVGFVRPASASLINRKRKQPQRRPESSSSAGGGGGGGPLPERPHSAAKRTSTHSAEQRQPVADMLPAVSAWRPASSRVRRMSSGMVNVSFLSLMAQSNASAAGRCRDSASHSPVFSHGTANQRGSRVVPSESSEDSHVFQRKRRQKPDSCGMRGSAGVTRGPPRAFMRSNEESFHVLSADQHVTSVAFDPHSHRLFFGNTKGQVFVYSLCPTIQTYGLVPCQFEVRQPCYLRSYTMNVTPEALPLLVSCNDVHGSTGNAANAGTAPNGKKRKKTTNGVVSLVWFPFLNALLSSGEDHRVMMLDNAGNVTGCLSAARLPSSASAAAERAAEGRKGSESQRFGQEDAADRLSPYALPEPRTVDARRTLRVASASGAAKARRESKGPTTERAAEDQLRPDAVSDACYQEGCKRYFDDSQSSSAEFSSHNSDASAVTARTSLPMPRGVRSASRYLLGDALQRAGSSKGDGTSRRVSSRDVEGSVPSNYRTRRGAMPIVKRPEVDEDSGMNATAGGRTLLRAVLTRKARTAREASNRTPLSKTRRGLDGGRKDSSLGEEFRKASTWTAREKEYQLTDYAFTSPSEQLKGSLKRGERSPTPSSSRRRPRSAGQPANDGVEGASDSAASLSDAAVPSAVALPPLPSVSAESPHLHQEAHPSPKEPQSKKKNADTAEALAAVTPPPQSPHASSKPVKATSPELAVHGVPALAAAFSTLRSSQPPPSKQLPGKVLRVQHPPRRGGAAAVAVAVGGAATTASRSPPLAAIRPSQKRPKQRKPVLPGTSEALQMRVNEYGRELKRCLKGQGGALHRQGNVLLSSKTPFA